MKRFRKLLSLVLAVVMVCAVSVTAWAEEPTPPTETFRQFCSEYYSAPNDYTVTSKNGENISTWYFDSTVKQYNSSDIATIYRIAFENVASFSKISTTTLPMTERGALQTVKLSEWFYELDSGGRYCPTFEIQYTLAGTFTYNVNTGIISSYTGPSISLDYCSLTGVWSGNMKNATTRAKISTDKYSITFTGNFKMETVCSVPIGDISVPGFVEILGPYYAEIVGQGE